MKQNRIHRTMIWLFVFYILFVIKVVILKYPFEHLFQIAQTWTREVILEGLDTANFTLFKTIRMYIRYADRLNSVENLVGNVVVFIPLGIFLPMLFKTCSRFGETLMVSFICVVGIELFQLFSAFGAFDVDDILLNCVGTSLGYGLYDLGRRTVRRKDLSGKEMQADHKPK